MANTSSKKIVIIVQARMGATRLPGKPLKKVLNKPLLVFLLERLKKVKLAQQMIVATTLNPQDSAILELCEEQKISTYRGSEEDVLDRYYRAASQAKADIIVRISGDCPLIDPQVVDQAIQYYLDHPHFDYVSNTLSRTFPRGMDVEIFSFKLLEEAAKEAKNLSEREHVTPYFYFRPEKFKLGNLTMVPDESQHRWTVDTIEDFELIKTILVAVYPENPNFTIQDLLQKFQEHPEWIKINSHIQQKLGEYQSDERKS